MILKLRDLELLGDKVEIVPASVAEEAGVERESDASRRCRRFLQRIFIYCPQSILIFFLGNAFSSFFSDGLKTNYGHNLHQLIGSQSGMVAGTDGKEDETGANNDEESSNLNSKRSLNSKSEFKVNLNSKKMLNRSLAKSEL